MPTVIIIDLAFIFIAFAGWLFDKKSLIYISLNDEEDEVKQVKGRSIEEKNIETKTKYSKKEAKVIPQHIIDEQAKSYMIRE